MRTRTLAAAALGAAVYGIASCWLMLHAAQQPWTVAAIIGPVLLAVTAAAWRRRHIPSLLLCLAALAATVWLTARGTLLDMQRLYVLQYVVINLGLGVLFALTLRRGATPLITRIAGWVHDDFPPPMRAYTARLTRAWVFYFAAMAATSLGVYLWAPWAWWTVFANLLTPLAIATFFLGEHVVRYRLHPEFERVSVRRALQAYRRLRASEAPR